MAAKEVYKQIYTSFKMKTPLFETDEITFKIVEGILIGNWKAESIDLPLVHKIINYRLKIQDGKSYPLLTNIKSVKESTKAARDYLASKEGCQGVSKAAIIISSPVSKMIANFFILASHPLIPTKMFTNEAEAKRWLMN